jgi:hypothetical protein
MLESLEVLRPMPPMFIEIERAVPLVRTKLVENISAFDSWSKRWMSGSNFFALSGHTGFWTSGCGQADSWSSPGIS